MDENIIIADNIPNGTDLDELRNRLDRGGIYITPDTFTTQSSISYIDEHDLFDRVIKLEKFLNLSYDNGEYRFKEEDISDGGLTLDEVLGQEG